MNYTTKDIIRIVNSYCSKNYYKVQHLMEYDDYLQESLLSALTGLKSYNPNRSKVSTYVIRVLWRHWNRYFGSPRFNSDVLNKKLIVASEDIDLEEIEDEHEPKIEVSNKVKKLCYSLLLDETRQYYLLGIKVSDIAKAQGVTKQRISNKIRKNIKDIQKECLHFNK